jgi:hypothetical protein
VNKEKITENFKIIYYFGDKKTDQNQMTFKNGDEVNIENGKFYLLKLNFLFLKKIRQILVNKI